MKFSIEERLVKAADPSSGQNRREIFIRALFTHESRKEVLLVGSNMVFRQISHSRIRADAFTPGIVAQFSMFVVRETNTFTLQKSGNASSQYHSLLAGAATLQGTTAVIVATISVNAR